MQSFINQTLSQMHAQKNERLALVRRTEGTSTVTLLVDRRLVREYLWKGFQIVN